MTTLLADVEDEIEIRQLKVLLAGDGILYTVIEYAYLVLYNDLIIYDNTNNVFLIVAANPYSQTTQYFTLLKTLS